MSWLDRLFRRRAYERDLDKDLRFHLESEAEQWKRAGASSGEAWRRARLSLGGVDQVKEEARDARGTRWLEDWWHDTRFALRGMRRAPGFTVAAILTLAVGIGANTAVWRVLDALLLRSLPLDRPEQLHVMRGERAEDQSSAIFSVPALGRLQAAAPEGARLAGMSSVAGAYVSLDDRPVSASLQFVTGEWFPLLGARTLLGHPLGPEDNETLGGHPVAVLSYDYWTRRFGQDSAVVGRTFRISRTPFTVVGVMEPGFAGLAVGRRVDLWVPAMMQHGIGVRPDSYSNDADTEQPWVPQDGVGWLTVVTRVDPAARDWATARLDQLWRVELQTRYAARDSAERAFRLQERLVLDPIPRGLSPLRDQFGDPLKVLMAGVGLVLLIACANLAGLLLARSVARGHELAVRVALGARPGRLMRQALTESLALALLGGALGLVLARAGARGLLRLAAGGPGVPLDVSPDLRVLGFAFGVAVLTGTLFGLAPAFRAARTDPRAGVGAGARVIGRHGGRLPMGRALVVSQIALSLVLVAGAGLFVRTLRALITIDTGYDREHVVAARLETFSAGYAYEQLPPLHQRLLEAVAAVPGVRSASLSLYGIGSGARRLSAFVVPGVERDPSWDNSAQENFVSPSWFETVGIPVLRGRGFTEADRPGPRVAIVSEATARYFFGTTDVVGRRIGYGEPAELEIVGVARDARINALREAPPRIIYYPLAQGPQEYITSVEARVAGPPDLAVPAIRAAVSGVDADLPVREVVTLDDLLGRRLQSEKLLANLAGGFGGLALLLAAIGLYGVLAYSVSRRVNEMGVRIALGAKPGAVRWLVLRDSLAMVGLGLGLGVSLWFPAAALVRGLVYGVSPRDVVSPAAATGLLLGVGAVAGLVPAWRASRTDPVAALRAE